MQERKKDIVWLDYARFLGIFLVIYGHALQRITDWQSVALFKGTYDYIYLFHMPVFFVISGYLFSNNQLEKLHRGVKILYSLILPYLLYQLLYLPVAAWSYRHQFAFQELLLKLLWGILAGDGYETPFSLPVCLPCWFLISIIQLRVLFLLVPINKITSIGLALFSVVFLVVRRYYSFDIYFCIDSTIMAIPYFLFGHYMRTWFEKIERRSSRWHIVGIIVTGLIVWLALQYNGVAQMNGPGYGKNVLFNYLAGFSGSIMVSLIAVLMAKIRGAKEYIRRISRNTLFIIFSHWVLLVILGQVLKKLFINIPIVNLTLMVLTSVVILYLSDLLIRLLGERVPILFGKLKYNKA